MIQIKNIMKILILVSSLTIFFTSIVLCDDTPYGRSQALIKIHVFHADSTLARYTLLSKIIPDEKCP